MCVENVSIGDILLSMENLMHYLCPGNDTTGASELILYIQLYATLLATPCIQHN